MFRGNLPAGEIMRCALPTYSPEMKPSTTETYRPAEACEAARCTDGSAHRSRLSHASPTINLLRCHVIGRLPSKNKKRYQFVDGSAFALVSFSDRTIASGILTILCYITQPVLEG